MAAKKSAAEYTIMQGLVILASTSLIVAISAAAFISVSLGFLFVLPTETSGKTNKKQLSAGTLSNAHLQGKKKRL